MFIGSGKTVICVAWSGIAATLLPNGRTVHSSFKLPLRSETQSYSSNMKPNSREAEKLREVDVIIWDEEPMASKQALEAVDILLQEIMHNSLNFGGKIVILGGDFRQTLPIIKKGSRKDLIDACINRSKLWKDFMIFNLLDNMRADPNSGNWSQYLLTIGKGTVLMDEASLIDIPDECISKGDLITEVFGEQIELDDVDQLCGKVILAPKNIDSMTINNKILDRIVLAQGHHEMVYKSVDDLINCSEVERTNFPTEFLNSLTPQGMPPHKLRLRPGTIVMLLRNINVKKGLCNGTRLIVKELGDHTIGCTIATGSNIGRTVLLPRIDVTLTRDTELPFEMKRRQFPITLAFAMTVNKSQGQTFERVGLLLENQVFGHGQLYVAMSRVRRRECLRILSSLGTKAKNIVFPEVFL